MSSPNAQVNVDATAPRTRAALAVAALVGGVVLAMSPMAIRVVEARAVAAVLSATARTLADRDVVVAGLGSSTPVAVRISGECTAALLCVPLLVAFACYVLFRGVRPAAAIAGLLAGAAVISVANILRICMIVVAWRTGGTGALGFTHVVVGSITSLVAALLGLFVQVRVSGAHGRPAVRTY